MLPGPIAPLSRLLVLLSLVLVGCSDRRDSAPVSGRVTLNGQPQEGIYIYFKPALPPKGDPMQGGSSSYARTDAEGRFTLNFMDVDKDRPGALVSRHTVTADDERTFGGGGAPDEMGVRRPVKSRVPRNWSASFEVSPEGTSEADFELSDRTRRE